MRKLVEAPNKKKKLMDGAEFQELEPVANK